jgi:hypothetical protein
VPICTAYGTLAISVGWLSEPLHPFSERAIQGDPSRLGRTPDRR